MQPQHADSDLLGVIIDKLRIHNLNGSAQTPRTSRHTLKLLNEPLPVCRLKILVKVFIVVKVRTSMAACKRRYQSSNAASSACSLRLLWNV